MSFTFNPTQTPKAAFVGLINYSNPDLSAPITEDDIKDISIVSKTGNTLITDVTFADDVVLQFTSTLLDVFKFNGDGFLKLVTGVKKFNENIDDDTGMPTGVTESDIRDYINSIDIIKAYLGKATTLLLVSSKDVSDLDSNFGDMVTSVFDKDKKTITLKFDSLVFSDIVIDTTIPEYCIDIDELDVFYLDQFTYESSTD